MTSGTGAGRTVARVECFVVSHRLDPRIGLSIALSDAHAYVEVDEAYLRRHAVDIRTVDASGARAG